MESGRSGLLDKVKVRISKILNKKQGEPNKELGKTEDQGKLKQESWTGELRDLAPIDNVENFETYNQALNWAFQNKKVKNIALSGPYGSGKSSIIETFLKTHPKIEESSIRVSLATFEVEHALEVEEDSQKEGPTNRKIKISEKNIEKAIVKQLLYKVDARKIPQSRYRKLYPRKWTDAIVPAFLGTLLVVIFAAIIKPVFYTNYFSVIDKLLMDDFFELPIMRLVESLMFVVGVAFGGLWIYSSLMVNLRIKEINVMSNAKVCDEGDNPEYIFDKDLDEVMYFFGNTKYKTVFFEDLDRLETPEIFVHLRELNYLLNNDDTICKKPIRFVYAVKDNIFVAEDRTKFFDLIIPVIPVVNSTNSGEMLLEKLEAAKQKGTGYNITKDFIFDMEPFISDMRTLNSIYNEFLAYKKMLGEGQKLNLEDKKIFAMMVFKNTYPSEFYDLQKEGGSITELLSQRKLIIEREEERLQSKIDELENMIKRHGDRTCESIKEVKWAMLCRLMNGVNQFERFEYSFNGQILELLELMEDDYDMNQLISDGYKSIRYRDCGTNRYETKPVVPEDFQPFIKRYGELKMLEAEGVKGVKNKIDLIERQKKELAKMSLSEMIDNPLAVELLPSILKENRLLLFLIRRGYIGEDYDSYVNNCRRISLNSGDMNFVLSIKSRTPLSPDYSLKRVDNILDRLQAIDLEEEAARNYDLLDYMLKSNLEDKEYTVKEIADFTLFSKGGLKDSKLKSFINSFAKWAAESSDWKHFFDEYSRNNNYGWVLIRLLAVEWKDMTSYILGNKVYPIDEDTRDILWRDSSADVSYEEWLYFDDERQGFRLYMDAEEIQSFLFEILEGCDINTIIEQNIDGALGQYLSNNSHILNKIEFHGPCNQEHFEEVLKELKVKFKDFNNVQIDEVEEDALDYIFENGYYYLNDSTLKTLFLYKDPSLLGKMEQQPYSSVLDLKDKNLLDYVHENFEEFIERCILTHKHPSDRPEDIVDIILRLEKNTKLQKELIEKEVFQLERIDDCAGEEVRANPETWQPVWDTLLERDVVTVTWENTRSYWEVYRFSKQLKKYVTEHAEILARSDFSAENEAFIKGFINAGFEISALNALLPVLRLKEFDLSISSLDERVLQAMINCSYFAFTADTFEEVSKVDEASDASNFALEFVLKNQTEFMQIMEDVRIKQYLFEQLILNDQFQKKYKDELFTEYAERYMTLTLATKMKVLGVPVTKAIFESAWNTVSTKAECEELLLDYYKLLDTDELEGYFTKIGGVYEKLAQRNQAREVRIPKTDKTYALAEYLKNIGYITSYKEDSPKVGTETHHELKLRVKKID